MKAGNIYKAPGKNITVLGSTGSIGKNALDVAQALGLGVIALAADKNTVLMEEQARRFKPKLAVMRNESAAEKLALALADTDIKVLGGETAVVEAASLDEAQTVLSAVTGGSGLLPALAAIERGARLALANKETLVCGGNLIMRRVAETGAELIPVDSEHSAVFQCLTAGDEYSRIILTASGGPFLGCSPAEMASVTPGEALRHPKWKMGAKVTIDSATLMNKGFEVIEAMHLFSAPPGKIDVLIHPQSVVHSMVEFIDGSIMAQLGAQDMRLPIQLALTWPERLCGPARRLSLTDMGALTFFKPDTDAFPCLRLALESAPEGDGVCAALNAADETAVEAFLSGRIGFTDIYRIAAEVTSRFEHITANTADDILAVSESAGRYAEECIL